MVQSIPQFEQLRDGWDALAARFATPLLEHDWFLSCAEAFHADGGLCVPTVRQAGTLAGAAPLVYERRAGGRRLAMLGASRLYEPTGWVYSSERAVNDLVDACTEQGPAIVLQRLPHRSDVSAAFRALPSLRALTATRDTARSLFVRINGTWDDYYGKRSSRVTVNLPRLRRKAERELGRLSVAERNPRPSQVPDLLEIVANVESSGWKGLNGSSLRDRSELRDFFSRYARRAAERNRLRVTTLSFGSTVAAVELSVEAHRRMWQLKIGYNGALGAYYPGLHLTEASLRSAFEHGLEAYEFLGSEASWQTRWSTDARSYESVAVYPLSRHGVRSGFRDLAAVVRRRARRLLQPAHVKAHP
jgi:CelD/BcsL family acetyltransferase involved in cellulose biosynthesis